MKRANLIVLAAFLGVLIWLFTLKPEKITGLRSWFLGLFSPVVKASAEIQAVGAASEDVGKSREDLLQEMRVLREENHQLKIQQALASRVQSEVDELRAALGFMTRMKYDPVPASVIKRTRASWWSVVTINRGANDGLTKDMPVIVQNGLVGRTTSSGLTSNTAEVLLITDEQCVVSVRIGEEGDLLGIVRGQRGLSTLRPEVRLVNIDKGREIPAGAQLYTTGEGSVYPPHLYVGRVLEEVPDEMQKSATVELGIDLARLATVFVLKRVQAPVASAIPP